jgi:hypothetical protein
MRPCRVKPTNVESSQGTVLMTRERSPDEFRGANEVEMKAVKRQTVVEIRRTRSVGRGVEP